mgnify:CR=1 FL=1
MEECDVMDTMDELIEVGIPSDIDSDVNSKMSIIRKIPPAVSPIVSPEKDKPIELQFLYCAPHVSAATKQAKRFFSNSKYLGSHPKDNSTYHFLFH